MLASLLYYYHFGQAQFILPFLVLLWLYVAWRTTTVAIELYVFKNTQERTHFRQLRTSVLLVVVVLLLLFGIIGVGIERVNYRPAEHADLALNQARLVAADTTLFGSFLPLWLHDTTNPWHSWLVYLSPLIIFIYNSLSGLLAGALTVLAITKPRWCVQFTTMFVVCLFISLPIWYLLPALSPFEAYVNPVLPAEPLTRLAPTLTQYHPTQSTQDFLADIASARQNYGPDFLPITTLPSMHIAWATGLLVYGGLAWPPLLIILIPYFILNALACVYTLQHYAVDIPAGILVALVAIGITAAVRPERWSAIRVVIAQINRDVQSMREYLPRIVASAVTLLSKTKAAPPKAELLKLE